MSVWLCRQEPVKRPFYIRVLDLRIYSSQELSYVIIHNPLFVLEGFVDDRLFLFVREQLDMGYSALKMERLKGAGEGDAEILSLFLQEADYCTAAEVSQFRQKAAALSKMPAAEYQGARAEYLFELGQYMKAAAIYESIIVMPRTVVMSDAFLSRICGNAGACYARLFLFERAAKAYEKSYFFAENLAALKQLHLLTKIESGLVLSEQVQELLSSHIDETWDAELAQKRGQLLNGGEQARIEELFDKDSLRRLQGAKEVIDDWKKKYRRMQSPS